MDVTGISVNIKLVVVPVRVTLLTVVLRNYSCTPENNNERINLY